MLYIFLLYDYIWQLLHIELHLCYTGNTVTCFAVYNWPFDNSSVGRKTAATNNLATTNISSPSLTFPTLIIQHDLMQTRVKIVLMYLYRCLICHLSTNVFSWKHFRYFIQTITKSNFVKITFRLNYKVMKIRKCFSPAIIHASFTITFAHIYKHKWAAQLLDVIW